MEKLDWELEKLVQSRRQWQKQPNGHIRVCTGFPCPEQRIPHEVTAKVGGAEVLLKPASLGTGVIAGGGVRAVVEAAGIRDILTKSLGSSNVLNVVKATLKALEQLRSAEDIAEIRGKPAKDLAPFWERRKDG